MGVSLYKIKKWHKMLTGKSIFHINQGVGSCYSKDGIEGYYNDLTEKVTKDSPDITVPKYFVDTGEEIFFSIGVFQYGLASYDLYLKTKDCIYKEKLIACADWAAENQQADGGWVTFEYENSKQPYSSMAQGEGISMLIRAHKETLDEKYILCAKKAMEFMLTPICEGGTALYDGDDVYLYEYTYEPPVLNGWIFSLWGLFDYCKYFKDEKIQKILDATLKTLVSKLPEFDTGYWSRYDLTKRICSPFYHGLHIAQLEVMYDLFGNDAFLKYANKWKMYKRSFVKPKIAFLKKAIQKILEK